MRIEYNQSFADYCTEITAHIEQEWPYCGRVPSDVFLTKLTEEVGELAGALLKYTQGRTDVDWLTEARKEFGDAMIVLAQIAVLLSVLCDEPLTMLTMMDDRWSVVRARKGAEYRKAKEPT